jgi:hypothetical protein
MGTSSDDVGRLQRDRRAATPEILVLLRAGERPVTELAQDLAGDPGARLSASILRLVL